MLEVLGRIEEFGAGLYPYRLWVGPGLLLGAATVVWWLAASGRLTRIARIARRNPIPTVAVVAVLLAVTIPTGWYLTSPLWTRTRLQEASPLAAVASAATTNASPSSASAPPSSAPASAPSGTAVAASGSPPASAPPASTPTSASPAPAAPRTFAPREVARGRWSGADSFHFASGDVVRFCQNSGLIDDGVAIHASRPLRRAHVLD